MADVVAQTEAVFEFSARTSADDSLPKALPFNGDTASRRFGARGFSGDYESSPLSISSRCRFENWTTYSAFMLSQASI